MNNKNSLTPIVHKLPEHSDSARLKKWSVIEAINTPKQVVYDEEKEFDDVPVQPIVALNQRWQDALK